MENSIPQTVERGYAAGGGEDACQSLKEVPVWVVSNLRSNQIITMRWTEESAKAWMKKNKPPKDEKYEVKQRWILP